MTRCLYFCLIFTLGFLAIEARPTVLGKDDKVPTLYEGDMALTEKQVEILGFTRKHSANKSSDQEAHTRGAIRNEERLWPNGIIPFVINRRIDDEGKQLIRNSMNDWEKEVPCIHFKQREREPDYIEFIYDRGCWSYVGHISGRQEVSIGRFTRDPPCEQGSITHELGHALGFYHEQNRPDRDQYVEILWHNMRSGTENNFKKYPVEEINSRGVEYDYGSLMHYSKYQGNNRPGVQTMKSLRKNKDFGQRKGPSKLDIKQARLMYKCDDKAGKANSNKNRRPAPTAGVTKPPPRPGRPRVSGRKIPKNCRKEVRRIGRIKYEILICRTRRRTKDSAKNKGLRK